jgi:hypothetical protein
MEKETGKLQVNKIYPKLLYNFELGDLHVHLIIILIPAHKHKENRTSVMPSGIATWQVRKKGKIEQI